MPPNPRTANTPPVPEAPGRQWLRLGGLAVALAAAGAGAWWAWPAGPRVETAPVIAAPAQVDLVVPAHTRLRDRYRVAAPLTGTLEPVAVAPGDRVRAGQVLAWLRPDASAITALAGRGEAEVALASAQRALAEAQSRVADAEAARDRARADAQRAEVLYAQQLIARDQVEVGHARVLSGDAALREATARHEAARARMDAAQAVLELDQAGGVGRLALEAPIDGLVLAVKDEPAGRIAAGETVLEIADPIAVEVVAELLSSDAARLAPGMPVRLRAAARDEGFGARVRRIEPGLLAQRSPEGLAESRMAVLADLDPIDAARARPGDGAMLEARILLPSAPETLAIPTDALVLRNNRWAAWVVTAGKARLRWVDPGVRGEPLTTVRTGLATGERVIRRPIATLHDGMRVRARP